MLRTNTKLTPLQVMRRYRDLLRVEQLFRQAKAVLATRPIYHSSDMAIRGHVFCSFLALLLAKELEERLHRHDIAAEWGDIRRDLDRLQEIELEQDGKRFLLRTPTTGVAGKLFQAVGVALPPNFQELPLPTPQPAASLKNLFQHRRCRADPLSQTGGSFRAATEQRAAGRPAEGWLWLEACGSTFRVLFNAAIRRRVGGYLRRFSGLSGGHGASAACAARYSA